MHTHLILHGSWTLLGQTLAPPLQTRWVKKITEASCSGKREILQKHLRYVDQSYCWNAQHKEFQRVLFLRFGGWNPSFTPGVTCPIGLRARLTRVNGARPVDPCPIDRPCVPINRGKPPNASPVVPRGNWQACSPSLASGAQPVDPCPINMPPNAGTPGDFLCTFNQSGKSTLVLYFPTRCQHNFLSKSLFHLL